MATNFPSGLDSLTNPTGSSSLTSPDHATQHADANDAIEALQSKVGVDGSAVTSSLDYKVATSKTVTDKIDPSGASTDQVLKFNGTKFVPATGSSLTASDTPPVSPVAGELWYESDTGRTFIRYDSAWVEIGNATDVTGVVQPSQITGLSAITSLTTDDVFAVVDNPSSATVTNKITAENLGSQLMQFAPQTTFRNAIINGDFRINQRGWSSSTASGTYGFDRWLQANSGGTVTMSSQSFTVGSPAATGYEAPTFCRVVTASQSATGDYAIFSQVIEDVRTFANSTITISFWAKAASSTPKVAIEWVQRFGSGGSPSADVTAAVSSVTLSTSWARYSVTMSIPNINGKTIGTTANTSSLALNLWVSAGSTFNSRASSIGIQNNTFDFWGIQVERGSVATPFEQRPIGAELELCQRYYQTSYQDVPVPSNNHLNGIVVGGEPSVVHIAFIAHVRYAVPMRATPTLNIYSYTTSQANRVSDAYSGADQGATSGNPLYSGSKGFSVYNSSGATLTSLLGFMFHYAASAEF